MLPDASNIIMMLTCPLLVTSVVVVAGAGADAGTGVCVEAEVMFAAPGGQVCGQEHIAPGCLAVDDVPRAATPGPRVPCAGCLCVCCAMLFPMIVCLLNDASKAIAAIVEEINEKVKKINFLKQIKQKKKSTNKRTKKTHTQKNYRARP